MFLTDTCRYPPVKIEQKIMPAVLLDESLEARSSKSNFKKAVHPSPKWLFLLA